MSGVFGAASSYRADELPALADQVHKDLTSTRRSVIEHFVDGEMGVALGRPAVPGPCPVFMTHSQPLILSPSGELHLPSEARVASSTEATLLICGDWAPIGRYAQAITQDPEAVYGDLLPELRRADLAVVNLEAVLASDGHSPIVKDGMILHVPTELGRGLAAVFPSDACSADRRVTDAGAFEPLSLHEACR